MTYEDLEDFGPDDREQAKTDLLEPRYFELKWREVGGDFFEQIYVAKDKETALTDWRKAWPDHIGIEYTQPIVTEVTQGQ